MRSFSPNSTNSKKADRVRAKKNLGQNFLIDRNMIGRMIDACGFSKEDTVLEIGPGTGALTRELIPRVKHLIAVETDRALAQQLREEFRNGKADIRHADFLKCDLKEILNDHAPVKVFGNLPYYISSPIITKILENGQYFTEFYLTVQKELAQRMTATPGGKEYGSFTCFVNYYAQAEILFGIKPAAFRPVPKVDSSFMRLTMRREPPVQCSDEKFLFQLIRLGFAQRRKTLLNAWSSLIGKDRLSDILIAQDINPRARAEELSLGQYARLVEDIQK